MGGLFVNFQLQEKIYNLRTKKSLSNDLTIKLYERDAKEVIAKIGVEYDGHIRHMTSYGILEDKEKDLVVLKKTGMPRIRVQPQMFQKEEDKKDIYRSIKNILNNLPNCFQEKKLIRFQFQNTWSALFLKVFKLWVLNLVRYVLVMALY